MPPRATSPATRIETLLGRTLAACAHPFAAWRSRATSFRVLVVGGYFVIGFVTVFTALAFFA